MAELDLEEADIMVTHRRDFIRGERRHSRYPYGVVWTPIPLLSRSVDSEQRRPDCLSHTHFLQLIQGNPDASQLRDMGCIQYWKLDVDKVCGNGAVTWDKAVYDASEEYKSRPHNLCTDNCHSHVAMALNLMRYDNSSSWNMMNLCVLMLIHGRHVSWAAFFKTWLPFLMISGVLSTFVLTFFLH